VKPVQDITDPRLVRALAHPLRVRILAVLDEQQASPSALAERLGVPLGNIAYHVRTLQSLGFLRLVKETPRRGSIEHHYTTVARPVISDEAWSQVPDIVKRAMVGAALQQAGEAVTAAAADGGFDRPEMHLSRSTLTVDQQGRETLSHALRDLLELIGEVERESAERLAAAAQPGQPATVVMMLFETAHAPVQQTGDPAEHAEHSRRPPVAHEHTTSTR
jgi:DNA-binding transcriptional ArsR family regulator